jgi:hypothetical protein
VANGGWPNTKAESASGRNAEPEDIAAGIVSLIEKPRPRMTVTRAAGVMMGLTKRLPLRFSEAVTRALNAESLFADAVDKPERRDYEDRARHS